MAWEGEVIPPTPDPFPFSLRGSRSLCISTRLWLLHGRHIAAKYPEITSVTFLDSFTWNDLLSSTQSETTCYSFTIIPKGYSCWNDKAWYVLSDIVSELLRQIWPSIEFTKETNEEVR